MKPLSPTLPSASAQRRYQRHEFQVELTIGADRVATIQLA